MEFSIDNINVINRAGIEEEAVPEGRAWEESEVLLVVLYNFREVPREGQHIGMLLLRESHVNSWLLRCFNLMLCIRSLSNFDPLGCSRELFQLLRLVEGCVPHCRVHD
jgi:hypothetical protein